MSITHGNLELHKGHTFKTLDNCVALLNEYTFRSFEVCYSFCQKYPPTLW